MVSRWGLWARFNQSFGAMGVGAAAQKAATTPINRGRHRSRCGRRNDGWSPCSPTARWEPDQNQAGDVGVLNDITSTG